MSEYTTEDVLHEVLWSKTDEAKPKHRRAFYRWLAKHDAEVAEKAWDEGALAQEYWITNPNYEVEDNPYRKAVQS